jgi:predicted PurR-regulated permease PerM
MIEPLRPVPEPVADPVPQPSPDSQGRPRPDLRKLRDALQGPFGVRNVALTGLFVLAAFYTLYFARAFFLPIVLAMLLSLLLAPVVRALRRLRLPEPAGAGVVLLVLFGALGFGVYELADPAVEWAQKAPRSLSQIEKKLRDLKKPVAALGKATRQMEQMTQVTGGPAVRTVEVKPVSLGQRLFSQATELVAGAMVMFILLYFFLASGDMFLRKLIRVLPSLDDKKRAVEIARQMESDISTYLATITLINLGVGLAVWGMAVWIGLPNPLLWAALGFVTNYIPYLGALVMIAVLAMVGFLTFPDLGQALLAPGAFVVINLLEGYIVTPMVLGRRLTLNPVVIFLGLTFWGWIWGITGALLAVPIMVAFKIFCDRIEPLAPIGEFLGN